MIAIGIGCRSGASKEAIIEIIAAALARAALAEETATLFTYDGKRDEAGLRRCRERPCDAARLSSA